MNTIRMKSFTEIKLDVCWVCFTFNFSGQFPVIKWVDFTSGSYGRREPTEKHFDFLHLFLSQQAQYIIKTFNYSSALLCCILLI